MKRDARDLERRANSSNSENYGPDWLCQHMRGTTRRLPEFLYPEEFLELAEKGVDVRISGVLNFWDAVPQ